MNSIPDTECAKLRWRKLVVRLLIVALLVSILALSVRIVLGQFLLNAAATGDMAKIRRFAPFADVNHRGIHGQTPLMQAVWGYQTGAVVFLLERGAKLDAQDAGGNTALIWAARLGYDWIAATLVEKGAAFNLQNADGNTAMTCAAFNGFQNTTKLLIRTGGNVNIENRNAETALIRAGQRGYTDVMELCRQHGAIKTNVFLNRSPYPVRALSAAHLWALATTALIVQYNGDSHEMLGVPQSEARRVKQDLLDWWSITSRKQILQALNWLVTTGERTEFETLRQSVRSMSDAEFRRYLSTQSENPAAQTKLRVAWRNRSTDGNRSLLAWDLCRHNLLVEYAYTLGFMTEREAWARMMPAARQLQTTYRSWEELGESYLEGREYWASRRDPRFDFVFELLKNPTDPNSPWIKLKWETDLRY